MFRSCIIAAATLLLAAFTAHDSARAASLSVSPIRLDIASPGNNATLTLRNSGPRPINAQVRVFHWSQRNGKDFFAETRDVVVSPPIASLPAGGEINVRVLRVTGAPVKGQENYRVVVDQIPEAARPNTVGINIAIRYALPLFIVGPDASSARIAWSVRMVDGKRALVAINSGDVHLRIANLAIGSLRVGKGLQGYVLGHSTRVFELPRNANPSGPLTADTDQGKLNASLAR